MTSNRLEVRPDLHGVAIHAITTASLDLGAAWVDVADFLRIGRNAISSWEDIGSTQDDHDD